MNNDDQSGIGAYLRAALEQARLCVGKDAPSSPLVGAVVVKDGKVLAVAFRGEQEKGEHAEFTALEKKLKDVDLSGCTVYTTLEPCTTRNHPKVPCAQRLIERRVSKVVIGMLDPNPNILGRGVLQLRAAGIAVELFPDATMKSIEELNRDFTRNFASPPPITSSLIDTLSTQSLDDWYESLNRMYWNRNFQRDANGIFAHLVEVIGSLSVLVSKKSDYGPMLHSYMAKAIAWWFALCGKVGVKSPSNMLWAKFPHACPYCHKVPHDFDECALRKAASRGPDWSALQRIGQTSIARKPRSIAEWQQMFAQIYPSSSTEDYAKTFAKLAEEVGELAEAVRVFPSAPGYFLSEASDVFAWLMKLNNMVEAKVPREHRGIVLQKTLANAYPSRCRDCNLAVCSCPPILTSTIGRIAHEVPGEFVSYADGGSFLTADKLSEIFGQPRI